MRILSLSIIPLLFLQLSCSKDQFIEEMRTLDGERVVNFHDYSSTLEGKRDHPVFKAKDIHRYFFSLYGGTTSEDGASFCAIRANLTAGGVNNPDIGPVSIGNYQVRPQSMGGLTNIYNEDRLQDSEITDIWGTEIPFSFPGNETIRKFEGRIRLPNILRLEGRQYEFANVDHKLRISRFEDFQVKYNKDPENDGLPIAVTISWQYDSYLDEQENADKKRVLNYYFFDDNGLFTLKSEMFKDIPKFAKSVAINVYRATAVVNDQDFYFLIKSKARFSFHVTD